MGYAKYYEDIVLIQSDREYMISSKHLKGRITSLKIDEAESKENKREKQSVYDSIKYSIAEVEYSMHTLTNIINDLRSDTLIEKLKETLSNLDNRRSNLYEYLYDEMFKGFKSENTLVISEKYKKEFKQFIADIITNLIKNLLPENSIELRRFEDDLKLVLKNLYNQGGINAFEDIIKKSTIDITLIECPICKNDTYNEVSFCINCLKEIDNE